MAQYKVPQDVEAEDKLLGPFTFRQFLYLLGAVGLLGVAFLLFRIFPLLAIIPVPFAVFFVVLALPLRKDQPMETYLAAVVNFYFRPRKRVWEAGEPESTILITVPKKVEEDRTNGLSQQEASRRLSFLAEVVDTEGYAIKGTRNYLSDEVNAEADTIEDIFETHESSVIDQNLQDNSTQLRNQVIEQLKNTSEQKPESFNLAQNPTIVAPITQDDVSSSSTTQSQIAQNSTPSPNFENIVPNIPALPINPETSQEAENIQTEEEPSKDMIELANNTDFTIETIAQQAKRINDKKDNGEVFISLR